MDYTLNQPLHLAYHQPAISYLPFIWTGCCNLLIIHNFRIHVQNVQLAVMNS